jgi:hypothetical protein
VKIQPSPRSNPRDRARLTATHPPGLQVACGTASGTAQSGAGPLIVLRVRWHGPPGAGRPVPAARSTTAAATTRAASAVAHIRARKSAPLRCCWPRTISFVRFEPTRNSEPALDSSSHPDSREPRPLPGPGGVHQHRRQERDRGIQVQRRGRDADHDGRAREQRAPGAGDSGELVPIVVGNQADQQQPVTRTNGDQSCDAAAAASAGLATTAATSPAIPVPASSQETAVLRSHP